MQSCKGVGIGGVRGVRSGVVGFMASLGGQLRNYVSFEGSFEEL